MNDQSLIDNSLFENRLIDMETKLAHQEQLLDELNNVVTDQQTRIDRLADRCDLLLERIRSMGEGGGAAAASADDERPPHY